MIRKITIRSFPRTTSTHSGTRIAQAFFFIIENLIEKKYFVVYFHSKNPMKLITRESLIDSIRRFSVEITPYNDGIVMNRILKDSTIFQELRIKKFSIQYFAKICRDISFFNKYIMDEVNDQFCIFL